MSSEQLHVRLPSWFKRLLREEAERSGEGMSEYIRVAVEQRKEREKKTSLNYKKDTN